MTSHIAEQESVPVHSRETSALLRQAIEEIRALKAKNAARVGGEPIAIIGVANRFPGGANTPEAFWDLLRRGRDLTGSRSRERGGFLDGVYDFDPAFFGISPQEAPLIDPQHRLLLEVSWQALEDALISDRVVREVPVGFFAGISNDDYGKQTLGSGHAEGMAGAAALGSARSMGPGRVAYFLGLTGPVMQVDTSCSSSLVAVHLACQSLRSGECEMAFAGGVNLTLADDLPVALRQLGALAADGRCKTFDAKADGYARGEGCGIVLLRPLSAALAAGDRIRAVIAGSAVNHDGRSNGLTAPNANAQATLIASALRRANLRPEEVQYVEAHGTGTRLGDPVELTALARVFGERRSGDLHVGSVKSNIGHLESAAGIAGLIKAVLMVEHGEIPPSLHVDELNPHFEWQRYGFQVPRRTQPWPGGEGRRAAGVSAFGMSGTNAHVVVTSAPRMEAKAERRDKRPCLLCVSARSEWAALELKRRHVEELSIRDDNGSLADYCYSTRLGRSVWPFRIAVTGSDRWALADALDKAIAQHCPRAARIGFRLHSGGEASLIEGLLAVDGLRATVELCREQPLYGLQCAVGDLWKAWGMQPIAIVADGASEPAARYLRGEISMEEGLALASGDLENSLHGAASAAVNADVVIDIGFPLTDSPAGHVPSLMPGRTAEESLISAVAQAWCAGAEVDWAAFDAGCGLHRIPLPQYPFQRSRYWIDLRAKAEGDAVAVRTDLLKHEAAAIQVESLRNRLMGMTPAMRRKEAISHIKGVVAERLGYPPSALPSISEGFFQIGMDSLAAADILNALRSSTGCPLNPIDIFAHPNVEALAEFILTSMFPVCTSDDTLQRAPHGETSQDTKKQGSALLDEIEEVRTLLRTRA